MPDLPLAFLLFPRLRWFGGALAVLEGLLAFFWRISFWGFRGLELLAVALALDVFQVSLTIGLLRVFALARPHQARVEPFLGILLLLLAAVRVVVLGRDLSGVLLALLLPLFLGSEVRLLVSLCVFLSIVAFAFCGVFFDEGRPGHLLGFGRVVHMLAERTEAAEVGFRAGFDGNLAHLRTFNLRRAVFLGTGSKRDAFFLPTRDIPRLFPVLSFCKRCLLGIVYQRAFPGNFPFLRS